MNSTDLQILRTPEGYNIKICGRANFQYGMPLRTFARSLEGDFGQIRIDVKDCLAMDSTFMGILAMIGLKSNKLNRKAEILNASEYVHGLLKGLGLVNIFKFTDGKSPAGGEEVKQNSENNTQLNTAETVVEAHKTLVVADSDNQEKFKAVIDFAEHDLQKLKDQQPESGDQK